MGGIIRSVLFGICTCFFAVCAVLFSSLIIYDILQFKHGYKKASETKLQGICHTLFHKFTIHGLTKKSKSDDKSCCIECCALPNVAKILV